MKKYTFLFNLTMNRTLEVQKICRICYEVLYYLIYYCCIRDFFTMTLGMSDPWVTAAYCANIAVTLFCVIYGIVYYNSGDDSGENK